MEPRRASQPWPPTEAPAPAWTKTIRGDAYTIKRVGGDTFGIWREGDGLGTFELRSGPGEEPRVVDERHLSLEARAVVTEFLATYFEDIEGPAKRI